ncbi:hypothetical protein K488DRAFT_60036 [Vararia minispora EC-137]|uniref:Uncharacterized protein n=1 Tax=Vararia minispora EC-137 TaxID=1314806 RepID=A0ACB8Q8L6_9AGAM|nr:hypothetical protein K488DRAFT_60036 [Vararia minispora EC-137]
MSSAPLVIPITLPNTLPVLGDRDGHRHSPSEIIEKACSEAVACCITGWQSPAHSEGSTDTVVDGVALGCTDGSVFLFSGQPCVASTEIENVETSTNSSSRASSLSPQHKRRHRSRSRSSAPHSSLHPALSPLGLSPPPRVVSGISNEQVQAPTNFVDFEEEQEKLKTLLRGGGVRETSVADRLAPSGHSYRLSIDMDARTRTVSNLPDAAPVAEGNVVDGRMTGATSSLSAAQSMVGTPRSITTPAFPGVVPPSPTVLPLTPLELKIHVVPERVGQPRDGVAALYYLAAREEVLSLQMNGDLSLLKSHDGFCVSRARLGDTSLPPPRGMKEVDHPEMSWIWKRMRVFEQSDVIYIFTFASFDGATAPQPSLDDLDHDEHRYSRTTLTVLKSVSFAGDRESSFGSIGDWIVDADVNCLDLYSHDSGSLTFLYVDSANRLISHAVRIIYPPLLAKDGAGAEASSKDADLSITTPFNSVSAETVHKLVFVPDTRCVDFDQAVEYGALSTSPVEGLRVCVWRGGLKGFFCSSGQLSEFLYDSTTLRISAESDHLAADKGIRNDKNSNEELTAEVNHSLYETFLFSTLFVLTLCRMQHVSSTMTQQSQAISVMSRTCLLSTRVGRNGHRRIELCRTSIDVSSFQHPSPLVLWKAYHAKSTSGNQLGQQVTCMLPLTLHDIVLGFSDGTVRRTSLKRMISAQPNSVDEIASDIVLGSSVTGLHIVNDMHTSGRRLLVGGIKNGAICVWTYDTLHLLTHHTVFTSLLSDVVQLGQSKGSPFHRCIFCIAYDGTIAVITLENYQLLYVIPAAQASLCRLCVQGNNVLLVYSNEHARVWNGKTRELWHAMSAGKACDIIQQADWLEIVLNLSARNLLNPAMSSSGSYLLYSVSALSNTTTLLLDVQLFVMHAATIIQKTEEQAVSNSVLSSLFEDIHTLLSVLLTPDLSQDVDLICSEKFHIKLCCLSTGLHNLHFTSIPSFKSAKDVWCISSKVSAARALTIICLLHLLGDKEELKKIVTFYATSLASLLDNKYCSPSLAMLASHWFDIPEIQHAAQVLLEAGVQTLSMKQALVLVNTWQDYLPFLQSENSKKSSSAKLALLLCGFTAVEKYVFLASSTLNSISKSVVLYLHSSDTACKTIAVNLCLQGFSIWQQYINAPDVLRSLFLLATATQMESSKNNIHALARQAILHILAHNTALFMTTLLLDIVKPQSIEHSRSVMLLVAFLIRKCPLIIYPNLPKLVESVVKSLDPNSILSREAVFDTATQILSHIVKIYPMIDFHTASQRLAVGTNEGAIVIYDMKTATRLYVLEGHKSAVMACSFSPDGRRLVTTALEEGLVLVWKVGTSFTSFFASGALPRQGHSGSSPFKSISFNIGITGHIVTEEALNKVTFKWLGERSVQLKIYDINLTFSI